MDTFVTAFATGSYKGGSEPLKDVSPTKSFAVRFVSGNSSLGVSQLVQGIIL